MPETQSYQRRMRIFLLIPFLMVQLQCNKAMYKNDTDSPNSIASTNNNNLIQEKMDYHDIEVLPLLDSIQEVDFISIYSIKEADSLALSYDELLIHERYVVLGKRILQNIHADSLLNEFNITEYVPDKCIFNPNLAIRTYKDSTVFQDILLSTNCKRIDIKQDSVFKKYTLYGKKELITSLFKLIQTDE